MPERLLLGPATDGTIIGGTTSSYASREQASSNAVGTRLSIVLIRGGQCR